jgi:rubredoxin
MQTTRRVEIKLAFSFHCPECGEENFVNSVLHEFTPEERADMEEQTGESPETGYWVTHPEQVKCRRCAAEFIAYNPGEKAGRATAQ